MSDVEFNVGDVVFHSLVKRTGVIKKLPVDHDGKQYLVDWGDNTYGALPRNLTLVVVEDIINEPKIIEQITIEI